MFYAFPLKKKTSKTFSSRSPEVVMSLPSSKPLFIYPLCEPPHHSCSSSALSLPLRKSPHPLGRTRVLAIRAITRLGLPHQISSKQCRRRLPTHHHLPYRSRNPMGYSFPRSTGSRNIFPRGCMDSKLA